jgi:predicted oxidoreductase
MLSRPLGRSPLHVSALAYGGWRLAGSEGSPAATSNEPGIRALHAAVEAGFTFFDFADIYAGGRCETIFGEALRASPGLRNRLIIATKCGIRRPGDNHPDAPYRYDFSRSYLLQSVEGSLQRMGLTEIDLLMLHRPDYLMDPAEVAGVFIDLRQSGKVREFGVSNFRPSQVVALQQACPFPLVVNQVEISLFKPDTLEDGTLDQCLERGLTPMAWSPLARGALVQPPSEEPDPRRRAVLTCLQQMAQAKGVTPAGLALAWLLKHPAGIIPIVGSANPQRIAEQAEAGSIPLSREEWYQLREAAHGGRLP